MAAMLLTVLFETPLEGEDKEKCEQELALLFNGEDWLYA